MKNTTHSPADVAKAATLFFMLRGLIRSKLAAGKQLDPYSWMRVETLVYIRDHKAPSMTDIAGHLSITAPSATSLINALAKAGLVVRKRDQADKRASRISLTPAGRVFVAKTTKRGIRTIGALFA